MSSHLSSAYIFIGKKHTKTIAKTESRHKCSVESTSEPIDNLNGGISAVTVDRQ